MNNVQALGRGDRAGAAARGRAAASGDLWQRLCWPAAELGRRAAERGTEDLAELAQCGGESHTQDQRGEDKHHDIYRTLQSGKCC